MDINNALQRAQYLMNSEEFNNRVDAYARTAKRKGAGGVSAAPPNEALLEQQLFGIAPSAGSAPVTASVPRMPQQPTEADFDRHPGLPREIVESFRGNPSPVSDLAPAVYEQLMGTITEAPSPVQAKPAPTQATMSQAGGVNYELIKYIVKECLKEQNTVNESVGIVKGMRIANGGTIQFIDTKGNLYEGKLVLKKKKQ